jgi:hypothetical protein
MQLLESDNDHAGLLAEVRFELERGSVIDEAADGTELLLRSKVPEDITCALEEEGLLQRTDGGFLERRPQVIAVLLAVLATRVAHTLGAAGEVWSVSTDRQGTLRTSTGLGRPESDQPALLLALNGLPQPRITHDHDLVRLADFALKHAETLARWRVQLGRLLSQLEEGAELRDDAIASYMAEIQELSDKVRADMQQYDLGPTGTAVVTTVASTAAAALVTGNPIVAAIGGVARTVATARKRITIRVRTARWRRRDPGRAYLLEAARAGLLRVPRR